MMKLSMMQSLVATLTDTQQSAIANHIATAWAHDAGSVHYIRASANFVFAFSHQHQPYILRFTHADSRADAIAAELAYLEHLATRHVSVALPTRSVANRLVETCATPLGVFHAVAFERLQGTQYEGEELAPEQLRTWGAALGRLHQAAQGYRTTNRLTVDDQLRWLEQQLPIHEAEAHRMLTHVQHSLAELPRSEQTFGLNTLRF